MLASSTVQRHESGKRAEVKNYVSLEPQCLLNLSETEVDEHDDIVRSQSDNEVAKPVVPQPLVPMKKRTIDLTFKNKEKAKPDKSKAEKAKADKPKTEKAKPAKKEKKPIDEKEVSNIRKPSPKPTSANKKSKKAASKKQEKVVQIMN